jgi:ABC-2 type transport system permease protein
VFRTLYSKELKSFFLSPFAWVLLAFVAVMNGIGLSAAMKGFRDTPSKDSLVYVAFNTPVFWFWFLFLFPLVTMRLFAEEERTGTLETLMTAPVRVWQVVLAKYAAALSFYAVLWVPVFLQFRVFGWVSGLPPAYGPGEMAGTALILLLMGAAFTAAGCLASALTSSQITAGLAAAGLLLFLYFLGFVTLVWGESFPGAVLFHHLSAQRHLHEFSSGLIDTRAFVYFGSLAFLFLVLTGEAVERRRRTR